MSLPKINAPEYRLNIPSTDEGITYRPFLVKEEKLLLIAHETGDDKATFAAIKQLIKSCVIQELAVDTLPMFDKEYVKKETDKLIKIRKEFYKFLDENIPEDKFGIYDFSENTLLDAKKVYELFYKLDYQARKLRGILINLFNLKAD